MMMTYLVAILCVIGLAVGQILFKVSALSLAASGSFFTVKTVTALFAAMCLYGITSIAWVWVLQKVELGHAYPIMALAFILVPLGSHFIFGENFQPSYYIGIIMIFFGIIITMKP